MKLQTWISILFAVLVICLSVVTVEQNQQMKHLLVKNLELQDFKTERVPSNANYVDDIQPLPQEYKRFEPLKIGENFYSVINQMEFTFQDSTGTVIYACENILTRADVPNYSIYICAGNNLLLMEYKEKRTIISEFTTTGYGSEKSLFDIGIAGDNLLVSFDHDSCLYASDLCVQFKKYSYRISLSDRKVHFVDADIDYMFSFDQFVWNPSGTKGVMAAGCPEGCPPEKYYGVDVITGRSTLLLKQDSPYDGRPDGNDFDYIFPRVEDVSWKDNSTAIIRGKEYTF
ncbi:MAG: hypothetical protein KC585_03015 [Candidatus Magasanikbacteria bacterium]|nr:hypothetical protein [Candidatus Magasanikbacteria bacterium]